MTIRINDDRIGSGLAINIGKSYAGLNKTMEKLTSGLRINRASDDPAGLVISENLRSKIGSLNQEIENTTLAIRKYETADANIGELRSNLNELRAQAVGAANSGFNSQAMDDAYQATADNMTSTYNHIVDTASFNGSKIFGAGENSMADVSKLENIDFSTPEKVQQSIGQIDKALSELDAAQGQNGAHQKYGLEAHRSNLEVTVQNLQASESMIRDTDYLAEISNLLRDKITLKAGMALLAHSNVMSSSVLKLME
ncbi:MAG: flagellin [candidate division Zixibacteria bacterium]